MAPSFVFRGPHSGLCSVNTKHSSVLSLLCLLGLSLLCGPPPTPLAEPFLGSLNFITPAKFLLPCKSILGFWGLPGHVWELLFSMWPSAVAQRVCLHWPFPTLMPGPRPGPPLHSLLSLWDLRCLVCFVRKEALSTPRLAPQGDLYLRAILNP